MRRKSFISNLLVLTLILSLFGVMPAKAASITSASKTVNLSATVEATTTVAVSTNSIDFGTVNPSSGNINSNLTVTVQSNSTYALKVYATDDFKTADATPKVLAINNLGVKLSTDGSYTPMVKTAGSPILLANNQPATASTNHIVDLQISSSWLTAAPGVYTTSLVFTATQL